MCFDFELQEWFDFDIPLTSIAPHFIEKSLTDTISYDSKPNAKVVWIGSTPLVEQTEDEISIITLNTKTNSTKLELDNDIAEWLIQLLKDTSYKNKKAFTYKEVKASFENSFEDFLIFWFSEEIQVVKELGLLIV